MKIKLEKRNIQIGLTIFFTVIALMIVYFLFFRLDSIKAGLASLNKILRPIFFGFIFSYLMTPLLNFLERSFFIPLFDKVSFLSKDQKKEKYIRGLSVLFTFFIVLLLIYLFFASLIPQVYGSIQSIIGNYNTYTQNLITWFQSILDNNPKLNSLISTLILNYSDEADDYLNSAVLPAIKQFLLPNLNDIIVNLSSSILKVVLLLYNFVIGLIISLYVLSGKEKFVSGGTQIVYAIFENSTANKITEAVRFTHKTFIGFLSGKVLDSAIIGVICYVCALFMKLPYPVLIGVIVGVTNIIPFFGPFFGAVPSAIIILMVDPKKTLYFIILILILQQIDGNFIGPKILSGSTGLNSFWIIFAITLFGGLFGVIGMVIGVPITAVLFTGIKNIINAKLKNRNYPTEIDKYYDIARIDEDGTITKYVYVKPEKEPKQETPFYRFGKKVIMKIKEFFMKIFKKNK